MAIELVPLTVATITLRDPIEWHPHHRRGRSGKVRRRAVLGHAQGHCCRRLDDGRPLYETGDARYAWLNKIQAIAKGKLDGQSLIYDIYEVC